MKMVYLAHPYGGKQENAESAQALILKLMKRYPATTFYSPLHAYGFLYNEYKYLDGMEHCFEALSRCDELWLAPGWIESRGCCMEYVYASCANMQICEIQHSLDLKPLYGSESARRIGFEFACRMLDEDRKAAESDGP